MKNIFIQVSFLTAICLNSFVLSVEVSIIDTRRATSDLGWYATPGGWMELTSTDETDVDLRTIEVCKIQWANQNNWIRTPFLNISGAQRIFIEVRFTIRSCQGFKKIASCKETFNLFYLQSNVSDEVKASKLNERTYMKLDTIAASTRFDSQTSSSNIETLHISPVETQGIYIAFQDTGACMSIIYVRVYYKTCPEFTKNLAVFPVTETGPSVTSLVKITGSCVSNAILMHSETAPSLYCNVDGKWIFPEGGCQCMAGYQPSSRSTECDECPPGRFKSSIGNKQCILCPLHSYSTDYGSVICKCASGYFRAPEEDLAFSCTRPPSPPTFVRTALNDTAIVITWSRPSDNGGRNDLLYSVSCERCDSQSTRCSVCDDEVVFKPTRERLTSGKVVVTTFKPNTNYKFKISSLNGVSAISHSIPSFAEVFVKTNQAVPLAVQSVRILSTDDRSAMVRWIEPPQSDFYLNEYQVQCSTSKSAFFTKTKETLVKLQNLKPSTAYVVQVRAKNEVGYGPWSQSAAFRTKASPIFDGNDYEIIAPPGGSNDDESGLQGGSSDSRPTKKQDHLILAIIVAASFVLIILGILLLIISKRRRLYKGSNSKKYPVYDNSTEMVGSRSYVDPSTYEDPYLAVVQFAREIDGKYIKVERTLGSGHFGEVNKGNFQNKSAKKHIAIKTLKNGSSREQKLNFLSEASIMGQFDHPNVIRLEGVVTKTLPLMIITEYMENGSLDQYLKNNKNNILITQLVSMLHQIATGMSYLSRMGYVHRDLAARNVLVSSKIECKISDFGLSRSIIHLPEEEETMLSKSSMIPVRWSPPEALNNQFFSTASDVWSFGILTWEVLTRGERPYWEMTNADVTYFVESGYRLPAPWHCPRVLHKIMLDCWKEDHSSRPSFNELVASYNYFSQNPSSLDEILNERSFRDQEDCIPEMMDLSSLSHWLEEIHLLSYKYVMLRHGCVTAEQIMKLTAEELFYMGISQQNHVEVFLQEAEVLRYKIEEANKIGVAV